MYFITLLSLIGIVANIQKKRWCFWVWLFTNLAWCVYDFKIESYAQSLLFLVYAGMSVWGLVKWK